jgi:exosome complex component CSL4
MDHLVRVRILKIDGKRSQQMNAIIRKQNIRLHDIDKIKMDECFLPGDIVLARLISYGDSHQIFLSTAEEECGVLFAKSQESGTSNSSM